MALFGALLLYLYFFSPVGLFPEWDFNLICLGVAIPALYLFSRFFHVYFVVLILGLLFNRQITGFLFSPHFASLDFLIQLGLFFWGIEIGNRFCSFSLRRFPFSWSPIFLMVSLFGIFYFFIGDLRNSLLYACAFSAGSSLFLKQNHLFTNLILYALGLGLYLSGKPFMETVFLFIVFAAVFLQYFLYESLLRKKFSAILMLFFISLSCLFASSSTNWILPMLPLGILAGFLLLKKEILKNHFYLDFLKMLLLILFISQSYFNWNDILIAAALLGWFWLLSCWVQKKMTIELIHIPVEWPLFMGVLLAEAGSGLLNLTVIFLTGVFFLASIKEWKRCGGYLFRLTHRARQNKPSLRQ